MVRSTIPPVAQDRPTNSRNSLAGKWYAAIQGKNDTNSGTTDQDEQQQQQQQQQGQYKGQQQEKKQTWQKRRHQQQQYSQKYSQRNTYDDEYCTTRGYNSMSQDHQQQRQQQSEPNSLNGFILSNHDVMRKAGGQEVATTDPQLAAARESTSSPSISSLLDMERAQRKFNNAGDQSYAVSDSAPSDERRYDKNRHQYQQQYQKRNSSSGGLRTHGNTSGGSSFVERRMESSSFDDNRSGGGGGGGSAFSHSYTYQFGAEERQQIPTDDDSPEMIYEFHDDDGTVSAFDSLRSGRRTVPTKSLVDESLASPDSQTHRYRHEEDEEEEEEEGEDEEVISHMDDDPSDTAFTSSSGSDNSHNVSSAVVTPGRSGTETDASTQATRITTKSSDETKSTLFSFFKPTFMQESCTPLQTVLSDDDNNNKNSSRQGKNNNGNSGDDSSRSITKTQESSIWSYLDKEDDVAQEKKDDNRGSSASSISERAFRKPKREKYGQKQHQQQDQQQTKNQQEHQHETQPQRQESTSIFSPFQKVYDDLMGKTPSSRQRGASKSQTVTPRSASRQQPRPQSQTTATTTTTMKPPSYRYPLDSPLKDSSVRRRSGTPANPDEKTTVGNTNVQSSPAPSHRSSTGSPSTIQEADIWGSDNESPIEEWEDPSGFPNNIDKYSTFAPDDEGHMASPPRKNQKLQGGRGRGTPRTTATTTTARANLNPVQSHSPHTIRSDPHPVGNTRGGGGGVPVGVGRNTPTNSSTGSPSNYKNNTNSNNATRSSSNGRGVLRINNNNDQNATHSDLDDRGRRRTSSTGNARRRSSSRDPTDEFHVFGRTSTPSPRLSTSPVPSTSPRPGASAADKSTPKRSNSRGRQRNYVDANNNNISNNNTTIYNGDEIFPRRPRSDSRDIMDRTQRQRSKSRERNKAIAGMLSMPITGIATSTTTPTATRAVTPVSSSKKRRDAFETNDGFETTAAFTKSPLFNGGGNSSSGFTGIIAPPPERRSMTPRRRTPRTSQTPRNDFVGVGGATKSRMSPGPTAATTRRSSSTPRSRTVAAATTATNTTSRAVNYFKDLNGTDKEQDENDDGIDDKELFPFPPDYYMLQALEKKDVVADSGISDLDDDEEEDEADDEEGAYPEIEVVEGIQPGVSNLSSSDESTSSDEEEERRLRSKLRQVRSRSMRNVERLKEFERQQQQQLQHRDDDQSQDQGRRSDGMSSRVPDRLPTTGSGYTPHRSSPTRSSSETTGGRIVIDKREEEQFSQEDNGTGKPLFNHRGPKVAASSGTSATSSTAASSFPMPVPGAGLQFYPPQQQQAQERLVSSSSSSPAGTGGKNNSSLHSSTATTRTSSGVSGAVIPAGGIERGTGDEIGSSTTASSSGGAAGHHLYIAYSRFNEDPKSILQLCEHQSLPTPDPKKGEVLVRIQASSVSMTDCEIRKGEWSDVRLSPYIIPGIAFCGTIYNPSKRGGGGGNSNSGGGIGIGRRKSNGGGTGIGSSIVVGKQKNTNKSNKLKSLLFSGFKAGDVVVSLTKMGGCNARYKCHPKDQLVKVPDALIDHPDQVVCLVETYLAAFQALHLSSSSSSSSALMTKGRSRSSLASTSTSSSSTARYKGTALQGQSILIVSGGYSTIGRALIELSLTSGVRSCYVLAKEKHFQTIATMGAIPLTKNPDDWLTLIGRQISLMIVIKDSFGLYTTDAITEDHFKALTTDGRLVIMGQPGVDHTMELMGKLSGKSSSFAGLLSSSSYHQQQQQQQQQHVQSPGKLMCKSQKANTTKGLQDRAYSYNVFDAWSINPKQCKKDLEHLLILLEEEQIRPEVLEQIPLTKVAKAHTIIETKRIMGHIVCTPWTMKMDNLHQHLHQKQQYLHLQQQQQQIQQQQEQLQPLQQTHEPQQQQQQLQQQSYQHEEQIDFSTFGEL